MTAVISHLPITSCISEARCPLRPWLECHLFHKASLIPLIPIFKCNVCIGLRLITGSRDIAHIIGDDIQTTRLRQHT